MKKLLNLLKKNLLYLSLLFVAGIGVLGYFLNKKNKQEIKKVEDDIKKMYEEVKKYETEKSFECNF